MAGIPHPAKNAVCAVHTTIKWGKATNTLKRVNLVVFSQIAVRSREKKNNDEIHYYLIRIEMASQLLQGCIAVLRYVDVMNVIVDGGQDNLYGTGRNCHHL